MKELLHQRVHFIGIGGIGMSALAKLLINAGASVSGSNLVANDQTELLANRGVKIFIGHSEDNITSETQAVIHTSAVNETNLEMVKAKQLGLPIFDYHEYLGLVSQQYTTIAIAGTHGKSTTTALVAKILVNGGFDPTVIIGSKVPGFDDNYRAGKSEYLVVEADEFNFGMTHLSPQIILLNNIEADHLDCYGDLANIITSFKKFVSKLPANSGDLFYNADDKNVVEVVNSRSDVNKFAVSNIGGQYQYSYSINNEITVNGEKYKHQLWGDYNDANLAMAISLAQYLKIDEQKITQALQEFSGIWRRFEVLTNNALTKNVTIVSDYAHHPTALAGIIKATQVRYADRKVWTIFQPHHYDRVSNFFDDFVDALKLAKYPVIVRTYDVPGREGDGVRKKTSQDIAALVNDCEYLDDVSLVVDFIKSNAQDNDVFVIIGAGTIDEVVRNAFIDIK